MSCLGILFSLDENAVNNLRSLPTDEQRRNHLVNNIEPEYFGFHPGHVAELEKSWDAIHRSLTDGTLGYDAGQFPLNHVILGGESLYSADDYIMSLKTPEAVRAISRALVTVSEDSLMQGYFLIDEVDYGFPTDREDFNHTWSTLDGSRQFWNMAAAENRWVLFAADQ